MVSFLWEFPMRSAANAKTTVYHLTKFTHCSQVPSVLTFSISWNCTWKNLRRRKCLRLTKYRFYYYHYTAWKFIKYTNRSDGKLNIFHTTRGWFVQQNNFGLCACLVLLSLDTWACISPCIRLIRTRTSGEGRRPQNKNESSFIAEWIMMKLCIACPSSKSVYPSTFVCVDVGTFNAGTGFHNIRNFFQWSVKHHVAHE